MKKIILIIIIIFLTLLNLILFKNFYYDRYQNKNISNNIKLNI